MTGLREQWPNLSPRERDVKVAETLGWKWRLLHTVPGKSFLVPPEEAGNFLAEGDPSEWDDSPRARGLIAEVPHYSSAWEYAGGLLDQLRSEGWSVSLWGLSVEANPRGPETTWQIIATRREEQSGGLAATAPEAIALAFCLSREEGR